MSEHPNVPGYGAAARKYELAEDDSLRTETCQKCGGDGTIPCEICEARSPHLCQDDHGPEGIDCSLCDTTGEVSAATAREYLKE